MCLVWRIGECHCVMRRYEDGSGYLPERSLYLVFRAMLRSEAIHGCILSNVSPTAGSSSSGCRTPWKCASKFWKYSDCDMLLSADRRATASRKHSESLMSMSLKW